MQTTQRNYAILVNGVVTIFLVLAGYGASVAFDDPAAAPDQSPIFTRMYMGAFEYDPTTPPDFSLREPSLDRSLLAAAVDYGYEELAADILKSDLGEIADQDHLGNNAMYEIVRQGDWETFETAFQLGPERAAKALLSNNRAGWSAIEVTAYQKDNIQRYLGIAGEHIDQDAIQERLADAKRLRRLHEAMTGGDYNSFVELLLKYPELANRPLPNGYSLLSAAGATGDTAAIQLLLAYGADVHGSPEMTMGPVEWALHFKSPDTLEALRIGGKLSKSSRVWTNALNGVPKETTVGELLKQYHFEDKWNPEKPPNVGDKESNADDK